MISFETTVPLLCHPATPCAVLDGIDVVVSGGVGERLAFTYRLRGRIDDVRIPPLLSPARADGLWLHTCCEAFLADPGSPAYRELNFSPSGRWAAYAFRTYREIDPDAAPLAAPAIGRRRDDDTFLLTALLPPDAPFPRHDRRLEIGLAVVIEANDNSLSYWALRHPGDKPDFHSRRSFALGLSDPGGAGASS
jgi:hypothetical protein